VEVTIKLDTSLPTDVAHLQQLANAFDGSVVAKPAPEVPKKTTVKPDPQAPAKEVKAETAETAETPAPAEKPNAKTGSERVTIVEVRAECGKKVNADCVAVFKKMGFDGLSKIPAESLAEALELIKALPNKA
jgi:cytoskeletal protein RodZ